MELKISSGNIKTGKIPAISLPPVTTCITGAPCAKTCYARKSFRRYKSIRNAWTSNLDLYNSNPFTFEGDLVAYLKKKAPKFFRWHVSGDIINAHYFNMVVRTALAFPETNFLIFTKKYALVNSYDNPIPENLSVVFSAWPGLDMDNPHNFPVAFMDDGTETRINNAVPCPGNCEFCGMCWALKLINKNAVFAKH